MSEQRPSLSALIHETIRDNWELDAFANYKGDSLTYGAVGCHIARMHDALRAAGVARGDRIAVLGKSSIHWAVTFIGALDFGAVIVPILPDFHPDDVHHIVTHAGAAVLFVDDAIQETLDPEAMPTIKTVISLDDNRLLFARGGLEDPVRAALASDLPALAPADYTPPDLPNEDLAALFYTSGTTGFSKGVMLNRRSLLENVLFARKRIPLEPGNRIVAFLPLAHCFGCAFDFLFPFTLGCHITFLRNMPSPRVLLQAFSELRPQLILAVPLIIEKIYRKRLLPKVRKPAVKALLKTPILNRAVRRKIRDSLTEAFGGNFRAIVLGGAPLNPEVEDFLTSIGFHFTIGYGMTECGPLISYSSWDNRKLRSCGKVIDCMEARIDSDDPRHAPGEIQVRGPNVMLGYYRNEEATRESLLPGGWLRTGDMGILDEDQVLFIRGRCKAMLLGSSGQNIYPEEIEAKLNNLPCILESVVVQRGEALVGLVCIDKEALAAEGMSEGDVERLLADTRAQLNAQLAAFSRLSKLEAYPQEFEKTPSKKIKRFLYK